jgi:hypothetical protein
MRPERRPVGYELVLHLSEAEARELANGLVGLFHARPGRGECWPNAAVAALDSHLTQFLNGLPRAP